jgi:hypothetical protein
MAGSNLRICGFKGIPEKPGCPAGFICGIRLNQNALLELKAKAI